jgi:hypothetical protein
VVISRSWHAAAFAVVVLATVEGSIGSQSGRATNEPPAIQGIENNLATALAKAKTMKLLRYHRHRTKTPEGPVNEVEWVNLATGQRRTLDYDASGRLTTRTSSPNDNAPHAGWNPSAACGCDLDPFTNFPGQALHVSLLGDQTIDGKPTFHLRFAVTGPIVSTTDFWIDQATHLPVRSKVVYRAARGNGQLGPAMTTSDEFTWLPRTSANLAQLSSK